MGSRWSPDGPGPSRFDNRLYVADDLARNLDVDLDQPRQPTLDVSTFLARALGDSRAKHLALDHQRQPPDTSLGIEL